MTARTAFPFAALAALLLAPAAGAQQAVPTTHAAVLRDLDQDSVPAYGTALLRFAYESTNTVTYRITVVGLPEPVTAGWIARRDRDSLQLAYTLGIEGAGPTLTGSTGNIPAEAFQMLDSVSYLVLATASHPSGYVVGEITTIPSLLAMEFDPMGVPSQGDGAAWIIVDEANRAARYAISWSYLSSAVTEAGFYAGAPAPGASALHTVALTGDSTIVGMWTGMSDDDLRRFRSADLHVGVRTASFPSGEIGGPLVPLEFFSAAIEPANEVPPVNGSTLRGTGYGFLLSHPSFPTRMTFRSTVAGAEVTAAHVHRGGPTEEGTVFRALEEERPGEWSREEDTTTVTSDIELLRTGRMYMNYHTAANMEGEARGQLVPSTTNLTGIGPSAVRPERESAPAFTATLDATGTIRFAIERPIAAARVDLHDASGARVASAVIEGTTAAIDASGLAAGVYHAQLVAGSRALAHRAVTR